MQGPHVYSATFRAVTVTVLQDLFQLLAAAAVPVWIHSIRLGQTTDAGDAEAELLEVQISRTDFTINGSGGSTPTPRPHSPASPAASTTVEANNTTLSTVQTVIIEDVFNVQAGWLFQPPPEERILLAAGITNGIIVHLPVGPSDPIDMDGTITFSEVK